MKRVVAATALAISSMVTPLAHAGGDPGNFVLPAFGYYTYGNGNSYALQVLSNVLYDAGQIASPGQGSPFYVASSAGQIQDLVVLATGASGGPVNTNLAGMDNAYPTPSGVSGATFFRTGGLSFGGNTYPAPDPGGAGQFVGDLANSWDTTLPALQTFLAGKAPVFFFNNNQTNSGASSNQNLAIWAQIWVDGPSGLVGVWDFTNRDSPYRSPGQTPAGGGVPFPSPPPVWNATQGVGPSADANGTDYVLAGGDVCYVNVPTIGTIVPCGTPGATVVANNLGANQAAYAVVFPGLNAALAGLFQPGANLDGYAMHVDVRMGCDPTLTFTGLSIAAPPDVANPVGCTAKDLNNGYEQIFLGRVTIGPPPFGTPEPGPLALLSLSLLSLLGVARMGKDRR